MRHLNSHTTSLNLSTSSTSRKPNDIIAIYHDMGQLYGYNYINLYRLTISCKNFAQMKTF